MSDWRLCMSLVKLFAEINTAHPNRPKGADGSIGDLRHQATKSDHNPNADGVVTAIDITTADFTDDLAEDLRLLGKNGDGRVKYVIYKGRICSEQDDWAWRPYSGFSQHFDHIHLSVSADPRQYDRTDPWQAPEEDDMPLSDEDVKKVAAAAAALIRKDLAVILRGTRDGTHPVNLTSIAKAVKVPGA